MPPAPALPPGATLLWRRATPRGRVVALHLAADEPLPLDALHPAEAAWAAGARAPRAREIVAGRLALRQALDALDAPPDAPLLPGPAGAPRLPAGVQASLSHKATSGGVVALAWVARVPAGGAPFTLGIDLEAHPQSAREVRDARAQARVVLHPDELRTLSDLAPTAAARHVRLCFSCKEALFKAVNPWLGTPLGFADAALRPHADGRVGLRLHGALRRAGVIVTLRWRSEGPWLVCHARARRP